MSRGTRSGSGLGLSRPSKGLIIIYLSSGGSGTRAGQWPEKTQASRPKHDSKLVGHQLAQAPLTHYIKLKKLENNLFN